MWLSYLPLNVFFTSIPPSNLITDYSTETIVPSNVADVQLAIFTVT